MNSFYCVLASFLFFLFFDKKVSHFLSRSIPKYQKLSVQHKKEWNGRNTSTVHAILVTFICLYVLIFEKAIQNDLVKGYSRIAEGNIEVAVGYLAADFVLLASDTRHLRRNCGYMLHHASAVYAYWFALRYNLLPYFANFRLLAEMSTPFVNLRWALSVTDSKAGSLYFYNGCIMTTIFFLSRIAIMPYFYYMVFQVIAMDNYSANVSTPIHVSWISVCIVLDVLNLMWFHKMMAGVLSHLVNPNTTPSHLAMGNSDSSIAATSDKSD